MATPGLYGIRVSMFIAMIRRYRLPQVAEWLVFIVPMLIFAACAASSGHLVKAYAHAHGYHYCGDYCDRSTSYIFAIAACPAIPPKE